MSAIRAIRKNVCSTWSKQFYAINAIEKNSMRYVAKSIPVGLNIYLTSLFLNTIHTTNGAPMREVIVLMGSTRPWREIPVRRLQAPLTIAPISSTAGVRIL